MDVVTLGQAKADAKKRISRGTYRRPFPGPVIAGPSFRPTGFLSVVASAVTTAQTFRKVFKVYRDALRVVLVFDNLCMQGAPTEASLGAYSITNCYAFVSGAAVQVTFGGSPTVTVGQNGFVQSDPIDLPSGMVGAYFDVKTAISATGIGNLPVTEFPFADGGNGSREGYQTGDVASSTGSLTSGTLTAGFGPTIHGTPLDGYDGLVGVSGDSIASGTGWGSASAGFGAFSGITWALHQAGIGYVNLARGGELLGGYNNYVNSAKRMLRLGNCTLGVSNYGTNDIGTAVTLAAMKALYLTFWAEAKRRGVTMYQATIYPRQASTDGWVTAGGQSLFGSAASETLRQQINQWLRAPVSAGAGNSALIDAAGNLAGIFDMAAQAEVNANGTPVTINPATGAISNGVGGCWITQATIYDTGTATTTTTTKITDSSKAWAVRAWNDYTVVITADATTPASVGQARVISVNSNGTDLSINTAWTTLPSVGATFKIIRTYTIDGVHPTSWGHRLGSAAVDTTKLTA